MKFTIAQHEEMLRSTKRHYDEQRAIANRMVESVERLRQEMLKYDEQIEEAKRRGLDGFDQYKFGKKRK